MTTVCPSAHCPNLRPCPTHGAGKPHGRGWNWATQIVPAVLARDRHTCVLCGKPCPHPRHHHVGHIVDRDHGGSDTDLRNLQTICASANLRDDGRCV